ncbi:A24 family peptidase [Stakelama sp. CBK3Z-3]|uniref:A24 family peptidase n=1 Tax=Stakelama flava TaxID=2860338 RepID=A0ABS6XJZ7_9SPHN|nr:A24 family peptidase [Stakelama flava]MBW4330528.1 A24 family peptidase [Stakelama flava]
MAEALWFWVAGLAVLGLIFGSFIATVVVRWPQARSALKGRSECDGCGKPLRAAELIPLLSFALQRGRCRECGRRIDAIHPLCEALGLIIGLSAGVAVPGWPGAAGAVFGWLLLLLGTLDLRAFWLPNVLTGALALAGIGAGLAGLPPAIEDRLIGGAAGFACLWFIALVYRRTRGREGLGGGDAKLLGAIGLWLGWRDLPMLVLVACMIGLIAVVAQMLRGRTVSATTQLPLGTLLALAAYSLWLTASH